MTKNTQPNDEITLSAIEREPLPLENASPRGLIKPEKLSTSLSFWSAILLAPVSSTLISYISVYGFAEYGWALFLGWPIVMGVISTLIVMANGKHTGGQAVLTGLASLAVVAAVFMLIAFEGLICIVMSIPLAVPLNMAGVAIGYVISKGIKNAAAKNFYLPLVLIACFPFLVGFESSTKSQPTLHKVVSTIEIDAPIENVWKTVVAFPQIEKEPEGILRLGFAYPINAKIEGSGVGAIRYCNFNTGPFVEPITEWQEPNLLAFDVKEQPQPMIETSPWGDIHTGHMEYIRSQKGQFRLYEKDGKTVVEGTTFYTHDIAPDIYWKVYSDEIIHQVHMRVLTHIKDVSENRN